MLRTSKFPASEEQQMQQESLTFGCQANVRSGTDGSDQIPPECVLHLQPAGWGKKRNAMVRVSSEALPYQSTADEEGRLFPQQISLRGFSRAQALGERREQHAPNPSSSRSLLPKYATLVYVITGPGLVEHLMAAAVDWERESYPAYGDFLALPFFVLLFPAARFLLDRLVFERVARRLILGKGHRKVDYEIEETRMKIRKFKESAWKCIYFLSGELLSLSVTYNEPWFTNTKYFWVGPGEQVWPDQKIKFKLKAVYMFSAGFYTYSIFALIFWETRRSDFGVSMSHHVATVVLIVLSYIFRFARVGSIVLAIHDASDVFLEIGKLSKYSHCEWLANVAFLLFAALWIVLRLTYFPLWILRSTSYEVLLTLDKKKHSFDGPIYYYVFNSLLFSLLVLHIYWWVLICRMLVRQIKSRNVGDDVRSDSEGEDEHEG